WEGFKIAIEQVKLFWMITEQAIIDGFGVIFGWLGKLPDYLGGDMFRNLADGAKLASQEAEQGIHKMADAIEGRMRMPSAVDNVKAAFERIKTEGRKAAEEFAKGLGNANAKDPLGALKDRARQLKDSLKSPLDQFMEKSQEIKQLFEKDLINPEEMQKSLGMA